MIFGFFLLCGYCAFMKVIMQVYVRESDFSSLGEYILIFLSIHLFALYISSLLTLYKSFAYILWLLA